EVAVMETPCCRRPLLIRTRGWPLMRGQLARPLEGQYKEKGGPFRGLRDITRKCDLKSRTVRERGAGSGDESGLPELDVHGVRDKSVSGRGHVIREEGAEDVLLLVLDGDETRIGVEHG